jgi:hypothetical protein
MRELGPREADKMMDPDQTQAIANAWITAWNTHDVEAVLSLYRDDAEQTSPLVVQLLGRPDGTVRGKDELRAYFSEGLRRSPELHFELIDVFAGVSSITVTYRNHRKQVVAETMVIDEQGMLARVLVSHRPT